MGTKVIYDAQAPPWGAVYDYEKPVLLLMAHKGTLKVQQFVGVAADQLQRVNGIPKYLQISEGFYESNYRPANGSRDTKSYFYVDRQGDVIEFNNQSQLREAYITHRDEDYRIVGNPLVKKIEPLPERVRSQRTRFDRIDREIVEEPEVPKKKPTMEELEAVLLAAAKIEEPVKKADPIEDVLVNFLKQL